MIENKLVICQISKSKTEYKQLWEFDLWNSSNKMQ